jgi:uncharacterized protein (DUF2252 family)
MDINGMMTMRRVTILTLVCCGLMCVMSGAAAQAYAATPRASWVVAEVYGHNHPYAATASNELDTKMATMSLSAYNFYRGTDHIFFRDMLTRPASAYATTQTGDTWVGGDTHLGNFDASRDSSGKAVFKVSDFDEGYLGQYVWDLRRLAASVVLAGRENGLSDASIRTAINTLVGAYAGKMSEFKGTSAELGFQLTAINTTGAVDDTIVAANGKTRSSLLSKYTQLSGSARVFQNLSNLVPVTATTYSGIVGAMSTYVDSIAPSKRYAASYYTVKDIHQKLGSGVGSLGKLRYYVLIQGPSTATTDDVILEMKQASTSVVAIASNGRLPAWAYDNHEGGRVAKTAKAQLINADVLIGYTAVAGKPYSLREKSPYQEDFDYTLLSTAGKLDTAANYIGQALASAHAISDQDYDATIVTYSIDKQVADAITSVSGLKTEIANFAFDYAAQTQLDWQAFVTAYNNGTPLY